MNKYVKIAIGLAIALVVGYGFGRYSQPARVETHSEETKKESETTKRETTIVEEEIRRPDGTIEKKKRTEEKVVDKSKSETKKEESKLVINEKPQWKFQGSAGLSLDKVGMIYGAGVERRILGPIFLGVHANTDKYIGATLSFEL